MKISLKLNFTRHANAGKANAGDHDRSRRISKKGKRQSAELRHLLGHDYRPDLVLVSPLLRIRDTAEEIFGVEGYEKIPVISLPELFRHPNAARQARIDEMWNEFGYRSLREYRAKYGTDADLLVDLGRIAAAQIRTIATAFLHDLEDPVVHVIGHAVILPAVMFAVVEDEQFLDLNMTECCTVSVEFNDDDAPKIKVMYIPEVRESVQPERESLTDEEKIGHEPDDLQGTDLRHSATRVIQTDEGDLRPVGRPDVSGDQYALAFK